MSEEGYIPVNIKTPSLVRDLGQRKEKHNKEGYVARYSKSYEWYWIDGQESEEVLAIGLFDSEVRGWWDAA